MRISEEKKRFLAIMKFIGNLFLNELLTGKVICQIALELMSCDKQDQVPVDNAIEGVCELLRAVGADLETSIVGKGAVVQVCGRLRELKGKKDQMKGKYVLAKRMQFLIQDVLDAR